MSCRGCEAGVRVMGPIEWVLVIEGIVLVVAGICGSTAYFSRPVNQDPDAFLRAVMGFWRTVFAKRLVLDPIDSPRVVDVDAEDDDDVVESSAPRAATATKSSTSSSDTSPVMRGGVAVAPVSVCTFGVTVIARSTSNDIIGREPGGLRMGVTGAADDAVANKLVLAIVAHEFGIKPYQVTLTRGHFGSAKAVRIAGVSQDEADRLVRKYPAV